MARYQTTDLDVAVAREMEELGPEMRGLTWEEILQSVIDEERSKLMGGKIPEGTCMEEGCDKPRREGKARCDEHQKALQNANYQKSKGQKPAVKKAAHHKEPSTPRPTRDTYAKGEKPEAVKEPVIARVHYEDGSTKDVEITPPIPDAFVDKKMSVLMSPSELYDFAGHIKMAPSDDAILGFVKGLLFGRGVVA